MARLRASWRTSLPVVQQPRNPQSESIARTPYHRADAALAGGRAIGFGIIAFVTHGRAGRDVGSEVEQDLELRAVAGLTFREVKREGAPIQVSLEGDLGRDPPAGAAQRLTILPPFGACSRDA